MSLKKEVFITVVMPCYNGERYLERSLDAFFSQDYSNKQLVVVDGKSTDKSHEIIAKYIENGKPLVWIKTPDSGISSAINIGIGCLSNNHVFGYLGSDDILLPKVLSEVAYFFSIVPSLEGLYFDSYSYLSENNIMRYRSCPISDFSISSLVKFGTIVGLQNIYFRGDLVLDNGFSENNKYSMDYDLYMRLAAQGLTNFTYIPKASTINIMDGNISSNFAIDGALEAVYVAVDQVGYTWGLLRKIYLLRRAKLKLRVIEGIGRFFHNKNENK